MYNIDKVVKIQVEIDRILNYESYKVRLEDDGTDIVLIAIPSDIHKALSVQSMCHQKDVIFEISYINERRAHRNYSSRNKASSNFYGIITDGEIMFFGAQNLYEYLQICDSFHNESRIHSAKGISRSWTFHKKHGGSMRYDVSVYFFA